MILIVTWVDLEVLEHDMDTISPSVRVILRSPEAQDEVSRLMDFNEPDIGPKGKVVVADSIVIKRVSPR